MTCAKKNIGWIASAAMALALAAATGGCRPRTPAERIQDKAEDAAHETKQGVDRAGKHLKEDLGK